jgi:hypothetical protein
LVVVVVVSVVHWVTNNLVVVSVAHCQQLLSPQQLLYNTKDITMTLRKEIG